MKQEREKGRFCATHGGRRDRLYNIWCGMKSRCNNPKNEEYHCYGGKGVKLCAEWENYSSFKEWAYSHGYDYSAPKGVCTIDRINNNGDYSQENCRFVNLQEQINNQDKTIKLEYNGSIHTIRELAEMYNMQPKTLYNRLRNIGMSIEKALSEPVQINPKRKCLKEQAEKELAEEGKGGNTPN